jgi:hypothetical protein
MDFGLEFVRGFYLFNGLVIVACWSLFCLRRFLWKRRRRRGKPEPGFFPTYTSAGNALHNLQAIAQPRVEYVMAEKLDDQADEDDEGEPNDPEKHLHRQLRRIRRGEKVERLTALKRSST